MHVDAGKSKLILKNTKNTLYIFVVPRPFWFGLVLIFYWLFNILAFAFQHNFDYVMYVKKNTNDFTEIGDVHNVNTKLGLNLAHL